jgi:hypothetical protein
MEQEEGNKEHFCTIHLCTPQRRGTQTGKIQAQNCYMKRRERKSKKGNKNKQEKERKKQKQKW